jgi:hypothetical protein
MGNRSLARGDVSSDAVTLQKLKFNVLLLLVSFASFIILYMRNPANENLSLIG